MQKDVAGALDASVLLVSNYESGSAASPLKKLPLVLVKLFELSPGEPLDLILEVERKLMKRGLEKVARPSRLTAIFSN